MNWVTFGVRHRIANTEYLSDSNLKGFDKYKYSCKDTGPLSIYIMHPFWNWLVQFCPKWMAPNLLTFSGFIFTLLTFLMFSYYDYNFYASDMDSPYNSPISRHIFALGGVFLFIAYTLDGIDGKQARRTGTSGPLGELFDHGVDSFTAGLIPMACYSIFGRGERYSITPIRMYFVMWNILLSFFLSHWEKYNTGVLFLPWGYDFSMWTTIFMFVLAGTKGHYIFHFITSNGVSSGFIFECCLYLIAIVGNIPVTIYNIYISYKDKTGYMRTWNEALRPVYPMAYFFLIMLIWICASPSNIVNYDPRAVFFLQSTIFSNICVRLIVAQMSNTRCDAFNLLLLPLTIAVSISLYCRSKTTELILLYALVTFSICSHVHYGICLVRQMCAHFHISCFRIQSNDGK